MSAFIACSCLAKKPECAARLYGLEKLSPDASTGGAKSATHFHWCGADRALQGWAFQPACISLYPEERSEGD